MSEKLPSDLKPKSQSLHRRGYSTYQPDGEFKKMQKEMDKDKDSLKKKRASGLFGWVAKKNVEKKKNGKFILHFLLYIY